MRLITAIAATASVPYLAISRITIAVPIGVATVASTAGTAIPIAAPQSRETQCRRGREKAR